ncbi:glycosyltransferase [Teredinibacter turnerae]|uniref:glycosyltransferase n=1 Tax=Teredinibacter turnerae TaxID=2426 RepID=UPI00040A8382|nr:glycosyltransferase family 2 protein [Teredinibacter turnerae]
MKVGVVVLNYNSYVFTKRCVESVLSAGRSTDAELMVYVIDNSSPAGDYSVLSETYKEKSSVRVLLSEKNLGFSNGTNFGLRVALSEGCEFLHICNPDVVLDESFYTETLSVFASRPDAGIASGLGYHDGGNSVLDKRVLWYRGGKFHFLRSRADCIGKFSSAVGNEEVEGTFRTDFVSCACAMVTRKCLESVGFLDEDYCLGGEEWQLSLDARRLNFSLYVNPKAVFWHTVSVTHEKNSLRLFYIGMRTKMMFAKKNYGMLYYIWLLMFVVVGLGTAYRYSSKNKYSYRRVLVVFFRSLMDSRTVKSITFEDAIAASSVVG